MATIVIDDVVKEVNTFLAHNPTLISAAINRSQSVLDQHTKPLTKIKGQFPQAHTLLSNVVQGFSSAGFNELGALQIEHKILKNYHQKVNFAIVPAEILSSYWAELYAEDKKPEEMPISKYIIENELLPKVIDNLATLEVEGVFDPAKLDQFGFSMNGLNKILADLLALDPAVEGSHTPFRVPINTLTAVNIVDEVTEFEKGLPTKTKNKVKKIFMSENNVENYILAYEDAFGQNKFQNDALKTRLGKREIVGVPGMSDALIFGTTEENFRRLIDVFDGKPAITDVQKQDYKVKIFMEFWKGYDFLINELVYISNDVDGTRGLGSTALNQKYYGEDFFTEPVV